MVRRGLAIGFLALFCAASALAQEAPPASPKITLDTTMGAVTIELDPVGAPKTSAHMLKLFKSKHYVGTQIIRVEPGFLIQFGDWDANLKYRVPPVGPVELETANNRHARGAVALARLDDPNSGRSSFYVDLADNPHLNAKPDAPPNTTGYAVFGRVVAGMDVLDAIAQVERAGADVGPFPGKLPKTPIVINSVKVE
jgi:cyclophilin family peptidyl-prolyl cis-trans isomerase